MALRASYYTFSGEQELPDEQGSLFLSKETRISMQRMQIKDKVSFMCVFEMSFQCYRNKGYKGIAWKMYNHNSKLFHYL